MRACVCVGVGVCVKFLIAEDYFIDIDHVWPKSQMMLTLSTLSEPESCAVFRNPDQSKLERTDDSLHN